MALNELSTHLPKNERRDLKLLTFAAPKRQLAHTVGYRPYNQYTPPGTHSPAVGHPWTLDPAFPH